MPTFRFNKKIGPVRGLRAFLNLEAGATRSRLPENGKQQDQARKLRAARRKIERQQQLLAQKERQITRLRMRVAAGGAAERWSKNDTEAGSLPDFLILGTQKGGTTLLYYLLSQHPNVEPATKKEINYFDVNFGEGEDWYRAHFPPPGFKEEQEAISGESSPYYLYHPHAPRRAAQTVPKAKLIALLRDPVDRAYSDYQHRAREGRDPLTFEQAIDAEEARLEGELEKILEDESYVSPDHRKFSYLARGIYVDQIQRWHEHFDRDQLLILNSEEFFEDPARLFETAQQFLSLPPWNPKEAGLADYSPARHQGDYTQISAATRRRLEEFFEPHNRRLYEYLGMNFGW